MNIKLIMQTWSDSLKLLTPESLRHFGLGSLNLLIRGFKSLAQTYILIVPIFIAIIAALLHVGLFTTPLARSFPLIITMFCLLQLAVMSVRPSVKIKNSEYYLTEDDTGDYMRINRLLITIPTALACWFVPFIGIPLMSLLLLIFHDTQHNSLAIGLNIFKQFAKTCVYLAPALIVILLPLTILNSATKLAIALLDSAIPGSWVVFYFLLLMINSSVMTVFYVKIKHGYYQLIFS
jgi:hypothetical protein